MLAVLAGLGLGLSLIVAIGAQNVFVLRQGVRREHIVAIVAICALSDAALILVGVAGLGALIEAVPWLITAARWFGAAFLLGYAVLAARRAGRGADQPLDATGTAAATHGDARWLFAVGAIAASCLWFSALGFGARYLGRWLRTPRAWRVLDAGIAVVMIVIAITLLRPTIS